MSRPKLRALPVCLTLCFACSEPSDAERLEATVDTLKVHLYAGSKELLVGTTPEQAGTRALLRDVALAGAQGLVDAGEATGITAPEAATPTTDETEFETPEVTQEQLLQAAQALYELRTRGQHIVRHREELPRPFVATALAAFGHTEAVPMDPSVDHSLLFATLWALKLHPRSPTPIPNEWVLYEASRVDADALPEELELVVRSLRSAAYAMDDYCDLALEDTAHLDELDADLSGLAARAAAESFDAEQNRVLLGGLRALSHGGTAGCYFARGDDDSAAGELERFVAAGETAGFSEEDLALPRAYLAYRAEDLEQTRAQLRLARNASWATSDDQASLDELIAQLDREEFGTVAPYFDGLHFGGIALRILIDALDDAGILDGLKSSPVFESAARYIDAIAQIAEGNEMDALSEEAASLSAEATAQTQGFLQGLWQQLKGWFSNESSAQGT